MDTILNNFYASKMLLIQTSVMLVVFWSLAKRLTKTNYMGYLLGSAAAKAILFVRLGFCLSMILIGENYGMIFLRLVPLALIFISVVKYRQIRSILNQKLEE